MIRIRILGSAAGGGLPQWDCRCSNCAAARSGKILPQTQSSIAFTTDDKEWWLINASPDLPQQIEKNPELQPRGGSLRNSPIAGVFLTNADIDHVLGIVAVRQQQSPLIVFANSETKSALGWTEDLLQRFRKIEWRVISPKLDGSKPSIFRVIALPNSIALQLRDEKSGHTALIAPAVAEITDELREAARNSGVVFFDGTFWSGDELAQIRSGARTAREMNHLPISDSLAFLRDCGANRKIYMHINNTNPILFPGSAERQALEEAGIEVGYDGLEVLL